MMTSRKRRTAILSRGARLEVDRPNPGDLWLLGDHRLYCGDSLKDGRRSEGNRRAARRPRFHRPAITAWEIEADGVENDNQNQNDLQLNKKWIAGFSILKETEAGTAGASTSRSWIFTLYLWLMIAANQITFRNYITWAKHQPSASTASLCGATRGKPRNALLPRLLGASRLEQEQCHFNDAYEVILDYMVGEAQKVGKRKAKQLTEITGVEMWGHWFSKSQFTPIPEWHYKSFSRRLRAEPSAFHTIK